MSQSIVIIKVHQLTQNVLLSYFFSVQYPVWIHLMLCLFRFLQTGTVPQPFFAFHNVDIFGEYRPVILRMSLNVSLSDFPHDLKMQVKHFFSQEFHKSGAVSLSGNPIRRQITLVCTIINVTVIDHLLKVVLNSFSTIKLQFMFVSNFERFFESIQILLSSSNYHPYVLAFTDDFLKPSCLLKPRIGNLL